LVLHLHIMDKMGILWIIFPLILEKGLEFKNKTFQCCLWRQKKHVCIISRYREHLAAAIARALLA
ncbi:hypothetical protein ACQP3L_39315, partial [Escherichia coli]